jgi:uncharacterized C2H2 Zn-finger protein
LTKKKVETEKVKCPDCDAVYNTAKGLSTHRRYVHGYVSSTPKAVWSRSQAAKAVKKPAPLQCADCDFKAKTPQSLIWHRVKAHDPANLKCPHCPFVASWKGGLTYHMKRAHSPVRDAAAGTPEIQPQPIANGKRKYTRRDIEQPAQAHAILIARPNGHAQESHAAPDGIPEGTLALALGRFQELCRSIAFEHDLPPRLFTSRLAGLIYAATVR